MGNIRPVVALGLARVGQSPTDTGDIYRRAAERLRSIRPTGKLS